MLIFSIERLGGQNLDSQRKYHTVFMVYRSINVLAPEYLSKLLANSNSVTSYSLGDTEEQTNFSSAQHKLALAIEVGVSGAGKPELDSGLDWTGPGSGLDWTGLDFFFLGGYLFWGGGGLYYFF